MKCKRNGHPIVITDDPEKADPYQLWMADLYQCAGCDHEVAVIGQGQIAVSNRYYDDDFAEKLESFGGADVVRVF